MNILVACEYSGRVRDAFIAKGHDAMSCDILPTDVPGPHYQGDVMDVLEDGWDMMIAFPPCTYICTGGQANITLYPHLNWEINRDLGAAFFMKLVKAKIKRKAIENPVGVMSTIYRKPDQIIKAYQFGHHYRKAYCLWLEYLPPLIPTKVVGGPHKKLDFWSTKRKIDGKCQKSLMFQGIAKCNGGAVGLA